MSTPNKRKLEEIIENRRALDFSQQNKLRKIELWFEQEASKVQQQNFASGRQIVETWPAVSMPVTQQNHSEYEYNKLAQFALQELQNFAFRQNQVRGQPVLEAWNVRERIKENVVAGPVRRKLQWNEPWHNAQQLPKRGNFYFHSFENNL